MSSVKTPSIFTRAISIFLLMSMYVFVPLVSIASTNTVAATSTPDLSDGYDWHEFTVRICHSIGDGEYINEFVNLDGVFHGHRKHTNDIIPNLTYKKNGKHIYYKGKNWPAGKATWQNNCNVVTPTPTPTPTVTPTTTPTATPTETTTPTPTPTATEEVTPSVTTTPTPTVTPSTTTTTTTTPTPTTTNTNNGGNDDEDNDTTTQTVPPVTSPTDSEEEETEAPEVLGERTCDNKVKLVGITYVDSNKNGSYDFGEQLLSSITGKVTYNAEDKEFFVDNFLTDNNGKWEMTLCPGEYNVTVNSGSLPKGVSGTADVHKVDVLGTQAETTLALAFIKASESNNWMWVWIALLILFVLAVIYYIYRKRREYLEGQS